MENKYFVANLKKELFVGILSTGSNNQKERALDTARQVFEWCVEGLGEADKPKAPRLTRKRTVGKRK